VSARRLTLSVGAKYIRAYLKKMTLLFRIGFFCFLIKLSMISAALDVVTSLHKALMIRRGLASPGEFTTLITDFCCYSNGLVGYTSAAPAPYHGFGIVLSWEPRSYLYVDGSYNSLELKSLKMLKPIILLLKRRIRKTNFRASQCYEV